MSIGLFALLNYGNNEYSGQSPDYMSPFDFVDGDILHGLWSSSPLVLELCLGGMVSLRLNPFRFQFHRNVRQTQTKRDHSYTASLIIIIIIIDYYYERWPILKKNAIDIRILNTNDILLGITCLRYC